MSNCFTQGEIFTTIMAVVAFSNSCSVKKKQVSGLIPTKFLDKTRENFSIICVLISGTVKMPLCTRDIYCIGFQHNVLPLCNQKIIGIQGMELLAAQNGRIENDLGGSANLEWPYSYFLTIAYRVCVIQAQEALHQALELTKNIDPLTKLEIKKEQTITESESHDRHIQVYKTMELRCNRHQIKYS